MEVDNIKMNSVTGVWPAMFTPLDESDRVDLAITTQLLDYYIANKASGLYLTGMTGIGVLLKFEERVRFMNHVLSYVGERIPIIVHVGAITTSESILLAKEVAGSTARGISAVGPIGYPGSLAMLMAHYKAIAESVEMPFYAYYFDVQNNGLPTPADTFCEELLRIPNIRGMKFSSPNMVALGLIRNYVGEDFTLFSGVDELFCHAFLSGADAVIGSQYNIWLPECIFAYSRMLKGDVAYARSFMLDLQAAVHAMSPNMWGFWEKAMLLRHGVPLKCTMSPLALGSQEWSEEEILKILDMVKGK